MIGNLLIGPFALEQHLTASNYLNFLKNELPLLMEDVSLETKRGIFLQHDEAPPHFDQITAYLNQRYENRWIGHRGPVTWPPRSPDLSRLIFFMKSN
jgi:hypothetical protein